LPRSPIFDIASHRHSHTHISPAQSEPIGLIGTITVDIEAELARLDPTGHRPLREAPEDMVAGASLAMLAGTP
jgi:hypothetical protein